MFESSMHSMASAVGDFHNARRKAALEQIVARLQSKSPDLLSYDDVREKLHAVEAGGQKLQEIALDAIIGSAGRYADFTRSFLPRSDADSNRWARIKSVAESQTGLPPIEAYQIGEVYFVKDGNHRVSVARELGSDSIQAYVTRVDTDIPLGPEVQPDDLIVKEEYADFLEDTDFKRIRPQAELILTVPGQYPKFAAHLGAHRRFLELEHNNEVAWHEAVADWYDRCYLPVVREIRERGILHDFPGRTETDLYLWVTEHRDALEELLGQDITPGLAAENLAARFSSSPRRIFSRVKARLVDMLTPDELESGPETGSWRLRHVYPRQTDRLFPQLLVAISDEDQGWYALDQSLTVAQKEGSTIHGLHVVSEAAEITGERTTEMREEFNRRVAALGDLAVLHIDVGKIARRICDRAQWADLIVLTLSHPPSPEPIGRLSSGLRTLLRRCTRPVLAVPQRVTALGPALLAFDGSPKSWEALYVATYLAGQWGSSLTVLTVAEDDVDANAEQEKARRYLDRHNITAEFRIEGGASADAILRVTEEDSVDWLLLGGYGASPIVEVVVGSTVEALLRRCDRPMLICR